MNSQVKSWLTNIIAILIKDLFVTKQTTALIYLTERIALVSLT
jgi:hypothetical protein